MIILVEDGEHFLHKVSQKLKQHLFFILAVARYFELVQMSSK
jgi:hypothetical protein